MELNEQDVMRLTHFGASPFIDSRTFRISDFVQGMGVKQKEWLPHQWLNPMDCEVLKADALGWKKGKVRLRIELEFIPDEPEAPPSKVNEQDALRSKLDL